MFKSRGGEYSRFYAASFDQGSLFPVLYAPIINSSKYL
jgi:hypothetical protein